jgi:hypothetical protein
LRVYSSLNIRRQIFSADQVPSLLHHQSAGPALNP